MKLVTNGECLFDKFIPIFLLIKLDTIHLQTILDKGKHVRNGLELEVDFIMTLADRANLLENKQNANERANVCCFLVDLKANLIDINDQVRQKVLCLLINIILED